MSKNGANVLLIFQCPVICPTSSQEVILVSDDSPIAQLCITEFLLEKRKTRARNYNTSLRLFFFIIYLFFPDTSTNILHTCITNYIKKLIQANNARYFSVSFTNIKSNHRYCSVSPAQYCSRATVVLVQRKIYVFSV